MIAWPDEPRAVAVREDIPEFARWKLIKIVTLQ